MEYWKECVSEALEATGIEATKYQIEVIACAVENAHENYGMAFGHDVVGSRGKTQAEKELEELKAKIDQQERWVASTEPCEECTTKGWVRDGWGRPTTCVRCDGKGRV